MLSRDAKLDEHFASYKEVLDEASLMWQPEVLLHTGGTKKGNYFLYIFYVLTVSL